MPPRGIALDAIAFTGLRGKGLLRHAARRRLQLLGAFWRLRARSCGARRADAVLGMGGYVCFPGRLMAARCCGKPLVLVNADAALLLSATARCCRSRERIAFGFAGDGARSRQATRSSPATRCAPRSRRCPRRRERFAGRDGALRLLVVGGSLGAQVLNDCVPQALALHRRRRSARSVDAPDRRRQHHDAVRAAYARPACDAEVLPLHRRHGGAPRASAT